jgi:ParB-like chromosome segregation protein Spo0J
MRTSREPEAVWRSTAARPLVVELPIAALATTLAPLRGPRTDRASLLAPLPLRVAPRAAGRYEVLDGFRRLAQWTRAGHTHVPVVLEEAVGGVAKARLLEANAPRRTLSPMDEARVVRALADDDHLTPTQIGRLLGRGRGWVARRLLLGRRLAPAVVAHVDAGRLSATTVTTLAALPRGEQPRLAEAIVRHGLRPREADAFLAAWQATDAPTREALLRDPRRATPSPPATSASPLSPTARELQTRFDQTERALSELLALDLTGFADPERRVLDACQRRLAAQLRRLGRDVKTIRRALDRPPRPPEPPKLAPYQALVRAWCAQGLRSPRILSASSGPGATRAARRGTPDKVTSKLAALHFYQLAIPAPTPPVGSFDKAAATRGEVLFNTIAKCATCHVPPLFTEPGNNLHEPSEIGVDAFQADRSPTHMYRTAPLAGLWTHQKGGFYHDGRFATLRDVLEHYNSFFMLGLTEQHKVDLVEYLKSL